MTNETLSGLIGVASLTFGLGWARAEYGSVRNWLRTLLEDRKRTLRGEKTEQ